MAHACKQNQTLFHMYNYLPRRYRHTPSTSIQSIDWFSLQLSSFAQQVSKKQQTATSSPPPLSNWIAEEALISFSFENHRTILSKLENLKFMRFMIDVTGETCFLCVRLYDFIGYIRLGNEHLNVSYIFFEWCLCLLLLHSYEIRTRRECFLNSSTRICICLTKKGFKRECHGIYR